MDNNEFVYALPCISNTII